MKNENQKKKRLSLLESTCNTRDIGGYQTKQGKKTKYNKLIRSDEQKSLSEKDIAYLLENKITTIIDMREEIQTKSYPSPFLSLSSFSYYAIPIEEGNYIPETPQAVPHSYLEIAKALNILQVFKKIASAPYGVMFHCSAGKDRTGVVSAILLLFASVDETDIIEDYMMTKVCNRERLFRASQYFSDIEMQVITPNEKYISGFLDLFRETYKDAENYFHEIGLTSSEIQMLKNKCME